MLKQRTIHNTCQLSGVGLHTGAQTTITFSPAPVNAGIRFTRIDLPEKPVIPAHITSLCPGIPSQRCTSIGRDETIVVHTVEHVMSVLSGLGISNLNIDIDGPEVPGLDGCGKTFLSVLRNAGIVDQDCEQPCFIVTEPIGIAHKGSAIYVVPCEEFTVSYTLHYPHQWLGTQFFSIAVNEKNFEEAIAPCRTFCVEDEVAELRAKGFGQGANYSNTLVVGTKGIIDNTAVFPDEFARHKVLDFIGDAYLLGVPIKGHVFAVKSGHALNIELVKKLYAHYQRTQAKPTVAPLAIEGDQIRINDIMRILPHRYPFLLVDRVIEIESGKKGIGIKNVTINDNFFEGHFPGRPVMPGVLMVEAMAQTAGVVILKHEAHRGKLAFFVTINNVKFRKVVSPGDQLVMEVEVVKDRARMAVVQGVAKVDGAVVVEAEMMFSLADSF